MGKQAVIALKTRELSEMYGVPRWNCLSIVESFLSVDLDGSGVIEESEFETLFKEIYLAKNIGNYQLDAEQKQMSKRVFDHFAPGGTMNLQDFFLFSLKEGLLEEKKVNNMRQKSKQKY